MILLIIGDKIKIKTIIAYILLILIIGDKIINYNYIKKELNKINKCTNETSGTITEIYKSGTKHKEFDMTIKYTINEKDYTINETYKTYTNALYYAKEEKIALLYNPEKPEYVIPKKIAKYQKEHYNIQKKTDKIVIFTLSAMIIFCYIKNS